MQHRSSSSKHFKLSLVGLVFLFMFGTAFTCSKQVPKVSEPAADTASSENVPQENLTSEENK